MGWNTHLLLMDRGQKQVALTTPCGVAKGAITSALNIGTTIGEMIMVIVRTALPLELSTRMELCKTALKKLTLVQLLSAELIGIGRHGYLTLTASFRPFVGSLT